MNRKLIDKLQSPKAIKWFWIILASPVALILLLLLLIRIGLFGKLPTFEELENPKSNLATEIYSEDGKMIGSFFVQNRSYCDYDELSPSLVAALIATEDMRFYSHSGIDFISLARVAVRTIALAQFGQGGGSTISQQLAKNLYPRDTAAYNNPISKGSKLVISKLRSGLRRSCSNAITPKRRLLPCTSIRSNSVVMLSVLNPPHAPSLTSFLRNLTLRSQPCW